MVVINGQDRLDQNLFTYELNDRDAVAERIKSQLEGSATSATTEPPSEQSKWRKDINQVQEILLNSMWNFLEELRSATKEKTSHLKVETLTAIHDEAHDDKWKLKEEGQHHRVMYRKSFDNFPFHTLCVEGIINGPLSIALCVAWEAPHLKDWWPQFSIPPFKVLESFFVQKYALGFDSACIRFKVPWPFTPREVVMDLFALYFSEQDMIVVTMNSVSEGMTTNLDSPPRKNSNDNNFVRMTVHGGFVLQKLSDDQTYFRTIANIDMKIDFVPPWVINFLSRQLASSGYRVFHSIVKEISRGNKKGLTKVYQEILATDSFYKQIAQKVKEQKANKHAIPTAAVAEAITGGGEGKGIGRINEKRSNVITVCSEIEENVQRETKEKELQDIELEIKNKYDGLEEREPEMYQTILAIDKILNLLKNNNKSDYLIKMLNQ